MQALNRITFDPRVMGGKPCIRGMRVTVGRIVGLLASGHEKEEILKLYSYLEPNDIDEPSPIPPGALRKLKFPSFRERGKKYEN